MIPPFKDKPTWLKSRGYLHVTPKLDILKDYHEIYYKVTEENQVQNHGFFPLIHSVIKERKYKKHPNVPNQRGHVLNIDGKSESSAKLRPLHYSTHIDSIIFGYYASEIYDRYNSELLKDEKLSECVTAYRKIPIDDDKDITVGKSTIHFANEAFNAIRERGKDGCVVLMFDIKSFFSELNHEKLKEAWCRLFGINRLNKAQFNVFKAVTDFRYILKDDLRLKSNNKRKRAGFDERKLAKIRKSLGTESFFESIKEFKNAISNKEIKVYKNPFYKNGKIVGIPQGLPISAVLANLYLLDFDKAVLENIVIGKKGFYRRYSDDILIICKPEEASHVEEFVMKEITKSFLKISPTKTEKFLFQNEQITPKINRLTSFLLKGDQKIKGRALTYLGFEFNGHKTLIKSSNLAKFYRRMIYLVKRKAKLANKLTEDGLLSKPVIFRGRLIRRYKILKLDAEKQHRYRKKFIKNEDGTFFIAKEKIEPVKTDKKTGEKKYSTTYLTYVRRAAKIMNEKSILNQVKKHKHIFNTASHKYLKK